MRNEIFVMERESGEVHPVLEGVRAHAAARFEDGRLLVLTNLDAPRYRLLAIPTEGVPPSRWSDRSRWTELIPEQEHLLRGHTVIGTASTRTCWRMSNRGSSVLRGVRR